MISRAQKDVELHTLRENVKAWENQLASQSLALEEARESLYEGVSFTMKKVEIAKDIHLQM